MSVKERYVGLMSGTSMDAVDAVLVEFADARPHLLATFSNPLDASLRKRLLAIAHAPSTPLAQVAALHQEFGEYLGTSVLRLLESCGAVADEITAIGSHGQTILHHPQPPYPYTVQIGDPNRIAQLTGITTVADFRPRDMAAGGQGAPLAPAFHAACLHSADESRVVLNIGGMANITVLPANTSTPVTGFDTGPGNVLMDGWIQQCRHAAFDQNGAFAASGQVSHALLERLLADPYFALPPPKSTGREHFHAEWLQAALDAMGEEMPAPDVQSTLCELTAVTIADAILQQSNDTNRILVCGGGVHNLELMRRLRKRLAPRTVESSAAAGVDPDWMEAIAFAWLARRTLRGEPGNLPSVTGAREAVILGGIWRNPGRA